MFTGHNEHPTKDYRTNWGCLQDNTNTHRTTTKHVRSRVSGTLSSLVPSSEDADNFLANLTNVARQ